MKWLILILLLISICTADFPIALESPPSVEELPAPNGQSIYLPSAEIPENCINTTNPLGTPDPLGEVATPEGNKPIYALIFVDEEARDKLYGTPNGDLDWKTYTVFQLERGDESLVGYYEIDIRILDIWPWDSPNNIDTMSGLLWEFIKAKRQWIDELAGGLWWVNLVDIIIGITAQNTPNDPQPIAGVAASGWTLDRGDVAILMKWQCYWMDDNLVQHEVSHLFYAPDHDGGGWCPMEREQERYVFTLWEDGLFLVNSYISYAYLSYDWCTNCFNIISTYNRMYAGEEYPYILVIRHDPPHTPHGQISPSPRVIVDTKPFEVEISVVSTHPGYLFNFWFIDGRMLIYTATVKIYVDGKHTVAAYYKLKPSSSSTFWWKVGADANRLRLR